MPHRSTFAFRIRYRNQFHVSFFFSRANVGPPQRHRASLPKVCYLPKGAANQAEDRPAPHASPPPHFESFNLNQFNLDIFPSENSGIEGHEALPRILENDFNITRGEAGQQYLGTDAHLPVPQLNTPLPLSLSSGDFWNTNSADIGQSIALGVPDTLTATDDAAHALAGHSIHSWLPSINNSNSIPLPISTRGNPVPIAANVKGSVRSQEQKTQMYRKICSHCPKSFGRVSDLERHLKSHDPADQRRCDLCGSLKRVSRSDKYREHLIKSHGMDENTAAICAKQWSQ
jgi:hypothetical protein